MKQHVWKIVWVALAASMLAWCTKPKAPSVWSVNPVPSQDIMVPANADAILSLQLNNSARALLDKYEDLLIDQLVVSMSEQTATSVKSDVKKALDNFNSIVLAVWSEEWSAGAYAQWKSPDAVYSIIDTIVGEMSSSIVPLVNKEQWDALEWSSLLKWIQYMASGDNVDISLNGNTVVVDESVPQRLRTEITDNGQSQHILYLVWSGSATSPIQSVDIYKKAKDAMNGNNILVVAFDGEDNGISQQLPADQIEGMDGWVVTLWLDGGVDAMTITSNAKINLSKPLAESEKEKIAAEVRDVCTGEETLLEDLIKGQVPWVSFDWIAGVTYNCSYEISDTDVIYDLMIKNVNVDSLVENITALLPLLAWGGLWPTAGGAAWLPGWSVPLNLPADAASDLAEVQAVIDEVAPVEVPSEEAAPVEAAASDNTETEAPAEDVSTEGVSETSVTEESADTDAVKQVLEAIAQ